MEIYRGVLKRTKTKNWYRTRSYQIRRQLCGKVSGAGGDAIVTFLGLALLDVLRQPLEALEQTLSCCCATEVGDDSEWALLFVERTYLGCTYQDRSRMRCRPSFSVTSAGDMAFAGGQILPSMRMNGDSPPGKSCLFANTSRRHSFISRSLNIRWSSCFASSIRSRSWLSTTKTRPCVPV